MAGLWERHRLAIGAVVAALAALLAGLAADPIFNDEAPPLSTTTTEQTTTTQAPTTTTAAPTTTEAPTTTVPPEGEPFDDVNVSAWLVDGRNEGVSDSSTAEVGGAPSGSFRGHCEFSHLAYADPIVYPGQNDAGHLHMFFGNDSIDGFTTAASLVREGGSTCPGGPLNRTGYWMPAVFDSSGRVVIPADFELYYKGLNTGPGTNAQKREQIRAIEPYPDGLRMISDHHRWKCSNGREGSTIPDCPAGATLTVEVRFPYCWDGTNLDSADHRSHMAFGTNNTWGPCPASHPVHLPELTEFAHFRNLPERTAGWSISSDMGAAAGSTFHADWFGGWHPEIQDAWLTNCIHGLRSTSGFNLCDRINPPFSSDPMRQLRPPPNYRGPSQVSGYTPMPEGG